MTIKTYNQPPYFDDFDSTKNYLRMLFRPGYSVQARELTQLQTVLQNQIGDFATHMFVDGTKVAGGDPIFTTEYEYVQLDSIFDPTGVNLSVENYYDEFVGTTITGDTSGVKATVIEAIPTEASDPVTLYVKYIKSSTDGASPRFTLGENIRSDASTIRQATVGSSETAIGFGSRYAVQDSIYYVNKNFVTVPAQSVLLSKYNDTEASARVMFEVVEKVVTVDDDITLNDNALGSPNEAAPGAHRYQISLNLIAESYDFENRTADKLVQIAVINEGYIQQQTKSTEYNEILKLLATRTHEESGNYTVNPYTVSVIDNVDGDPDKMTAVIEPSVSYVEGNRIENISPVYVTIDRSRDPIKDIKTYNSSASYISYGNFVTVTNVSGIPDISVLEEVDLYEADGTTSVGTARIRAMVPFGSNYRVYLFAIKITGVRNNLAKLDQGSLPNLTCDLVTPGLIEDAGNNIAVFNTAYTGVNSLSDITLTTQRKLSNTVSAGSLTLETGSGDELFVDYDSIILVNQAGSVIDNTTLTMTPAGTVVGQNLDITGAGLPADGQTVYAIASIFKSDTKAVPKSKVLNENVEVEIQSPNTTQGGFDLLTYADIYKLKGVYMSADFVTTPTTADQDITSRYILDNGQRDNFYDNGRIRLRSDAAAPTGRLLVVIDYFSHGSTGDFFTADSYTTQIDWNDIPSYTSTSGNTYELRSAIDARPRISSDGINFTGIGSSRGEMLEPSSLLVADVEVYLPRRDKLYVTNTGEFSVARGTSALSPNYPADPENSMVIYTLDIPPYTGDPSKVVLNMIDNKRYTMRDIGQLEKRINNLEYYTTLSLLEKDVLSSSTLDNSGTDRFRNGFVVDGFYGHNVGDVTNSDYVVSMDFKEGILRPHFYQDSVGLKTSTMTGAEVNGDLITLPILSHEKTIEQPYASTFENLNPYLVFKFDSNLVLNPESDDWMDVDRRPAINIDLTGIYDAVEFLAEETGVLGTEWNSWETTWSGVTNRTGGTFGRQTATTTTNQTATGTLTSLSGQSTTQNLGDKVVDINIVPFIRSRRVYFYAGRLKPSTNMHLFFDNKDISSYARNEMVDQPNYDVWVANQGDVEIYNNSTAHPEGANTLKTSDDGEIWGSFIVPSNEALQFKTGQRVVRLTDSSTNNLDEATSTAEATYAAQGFVKAVEGTTVSTKVPQFETTELTRNRVLTSTRRWNVPRPNPPSSDGGGVTGSRWTAGAGGWSNPTRVDPLAQTFMISDAGGAFITKIDTYFKTISDTSGVLCQLREVVNGYPSAKVIAEKMLLNGNPAIVASENATAATTFEFDSPVYLKAGVEYAFMLKADDDKYLAWVSELGDFDVTDTNFRITKQPNAGVMFKSANASTWTAEQFKDIKFTLYRAMFDISGSGEFELENKVIAAKLLTKTDPFITYTGSSLVRVNHYNHGLTVGSMVTFSGVAEGDNEINGVHTDIYNDVNGFAVQNVELDSYVIDLSTSVVGGNKVSDANGTGGGSAVKATENKQMSIVKPMIQEIVLPETSVSWELKTTDLSYTPESTYVPILENSNFDLRAPRLVASRDNMGGASSLFLKGMLTSAQDNLSPVVDTQRMSMVLVSNRVDNVTSSADISNDPNGLVRFIDETAAKDNSGATRYITRPIVLEEDANDIKLWLKVSRPSNAYVDVYYRLKEDDTQQLADTDWTLIEPTAAMPITDSADRYAEVEYDEEGVGTFSAFQIKIVMRSTDKSKVPLIKDLRVVALS